MSIRSFVTCSSVILMAWLGWAYFHSPVVRGGADPVAAEASSVEVEEPRKLTVSVSPSDVTPD